MAGVLILGSRLEEEELKSLLEQYGHKVYVTIDIINAPNQQELELLVARMNGLDDKNKAFIEEFRQSRYQCIPLVIVASRANIPELATYTSRYDLPVKFTYGNNKSVTSLINDVLLHNKVTNESSPNELIAKNISRHIKTIETLSIKLTEVIKLNSDMIAQQGHKELLKVFCTGGKKILSAENVITAIINKDNEEMLDLYNSKRDSAKKQLPKKIPDIFQQYKNATILFQENIGFSPETLGLPSEYDLRSIIIIPLHSQKTNYGYAFFVNKKNKKKFISDDLYLAQSLGMQFLIIKENLALTFRLEKQRHLLEDEIIERRKFQQRLECQYEVARILAESPNIIFATPEILKTICTKLGWDVGNLWAVDSHKNALRCINSWIIESIKNPNYETNIQDIFLAKNESIPGKVWANKEIMFLTSQEANFNNLLLPIKKELGVNTIVALPISYRDEILGVIEFLSRKTIMPDKDTRKILTATASQIATFIKRKRAEKELVYLVEHDPLTRLANRQLLIYFLNNALIRAKQHRHRVAVLFIDLDDFKSINDTLGHIIGDKLLKKAATRLKSSLRSQDLIARLGGDEFVVVLDNIIFSDAVVVVAKKLITILSEPFLIDHHDCHVSASIGISLYPNDGKDVKTLIHSADLALYKAKEAGRCKYRFSTNEMNQTS